MKNVQKKLFIIVCFICIILSMHKMDVMAATSTSNISVNSTKSDSSSNGDEKLYYFSLSSAGKVNVTFTHSNLSTTSEQWKLILYNADEENLMEMSSAGTETNKTSTDVGLPAGTYYVKLNARHSGTQSYTLKVNYSASDNWEKEK